jgi:beta-galactosidase
VTLPRVELKATATEVQDVKPRGPWTYGAALSWRPEPLPVKPTVAEFAGAAIWKIEVPPVPTGAPVSDVWLKIDYQGDEARLSGKRGLMDDNFWNGLPWRVGLKETLPDWRSAGSDLELQVLPLAKTYPMYLEKGSELHFNVEGVADRLMDVRLIPQYQLVLDVAERR